MLTIDSSIILTITLHFLLLASSLALLDASELTTAITALISVLVYLGQVSPQFVEEDLWKREEPPSATSLSSSQSLISLLDLSSSSPEDGQEITFSYHGTSGGVIVDQGGTEIYPVGSKGRLFSPPMSSKSISFEDSIPID